MALKVRDPQQNQHRWTGTLICYKRIRIGKVILNVGDEVIFVKTSRDSHFVSQGTYIRDLIILSGEGDPNQAVRAISPSRKIPRSVKIRMLADLKEYKGKPKPIVEILAIDHATTPPLPKVINALTRGLFNDDDWLGQNNKLVGSDDIKRGRDLLPLPLKKRYLKK